MLDRIWFGISNLYAIKRYMRLSGMQLTDFVCILAFLITEIFKLRINTGWKSNGRFVNNLFREIVTSSTNQPLVSWDYIILSPFLIKLGLIKQFVNTLDKGGACFKTFLWLSSEKLKAGIFYGIQIRKVIKDRTFSLNMTKVEEDSRNSYVLVVKDFLESRKAQN